MSTWDEAGYLYVMPVTSMNHFTVLAEDLTATAKFYVELLGLEEGERPSLGFPGAWLYAGGQAVLRRMNKRRSVGFALKCAFVLLSASALGCAPVELQLPPELAQGAQHYEVKSKAEGMFSEKSTLSAGPYTLSTDFARNEEESREASLMRTTKTVMTQVRLSRSGVAGLLAEAQCVDFFAWSKRDGIVLAENVVDTFSCEGQAGDKPWSLLVTENDDMSYEGVFTQGAVRLPVRAIHDSMGSMRGAIRGYSIGEVGEVRAASQLVYSNQPGGLWLNQADKPGPGEIAALLSLLSFSPGK